MAPLTASGSASSDYFEDDDPAFLQALRETKLPGDLTPPPPAPERPQQAGTSAALPQSDRTTEKKRKRQKEADSDGGDEAPRVHHGVLASIDDDEEKSKYLQSHTYGASSFGNWGEYMARKRAKLQIQNAEMDESSESGDRPLSRIFRGLQIYVSVYPTLLWSLLILNASGRLTVTRPPQCKNCASS